MSSICPRITRTNGDLYLDGMMNGRKSTLTATASVEESLAKCSRPPPARQVLDMIFNQLQVGIPRSQWQLAVDVGCGYGQASEQLAKDFTVVKGFDTNPDRIAQAANICDPRMGNVLFEVSPAEMLPVDDESVQLLFAMESAHEFNWEQFMMEADRVLQMNGLLALVGYFNPRIYNLDNDKRMEDNYDLMYLLDYYYNHPNLRKHWNHEKQSLLINRYKSLRLPVNYSVSRIDPVSVGFRVNGQQAIDFVRTWSGFVNCANKEPALASEWLEELTTDLSHLLNKDNLEDAKLLMKYDYFILMGRKSITDTMIYPDCRTPEVRL